MVGKAGGEGSRAVGVGVDSGGAAWFIVNSGQHSIGVDLIRYGSEGGRMHSRTRRIEVLHRYVRVVQKTTYFLLNYLGRHLLRVKYPAT